MLAFLAALAAAAQPASAPPAPTIGRTAWVFSTISNGEWCPAGNVRLDLRTGRYELTQGARRPVCNDRNLERPVTTGTLPGPSLADIRTAYLRALGDGLVEPACRDGTGPTRIVVGGKMILVLASGSQTISPPDDLSCWSEAASFLQNLLDHQFRAQRPRQAP
jgi:hypothetical protein